MQMPDPDDLTAEDLADLIRHGRTMRPDIVRLSAESGVDRATIHRWTAGFGLRTVVAFFRVCRHAGLEIVVRRPTKRV